VPSTAPRRYPSTVGSTRVYAIGSASWYPVQRYGPYNYENHLFLVCLFKSGAAYFITVFRSVDKGLTWVESDVANRKSTTATTSVSGAFLCSPVRHAHLIYVAHNNVARIEQFSMNENAWGTVVATGGPTVLDPGLGGTARMFLSYRTDGSFVLMYTAFDVFGGGNRGRVKYATYINSAWSGSNPITSHGADFFQDRPVGIVRGASNRVHMFFTSSETGNGAALFHVSLSNVGVLDTYGQLGGSAKCHTSTTDDSFQPVGAPIYTNSKVLIPYLKSFSSPSADGVIVASASSQANPTFTNEVPPHLNTSALRDYAPTREERGSMLSLSQGSTSIGIFQSDNVDDAVGADFEDDQIHYLDLPVINGDEDEVFLFSCQNDGDTDAPRTYYVYNRRSTSGVWGTPLTVYAARGLRGLYAGPTEDCINQAVAAEECIVIY